MLLYYVHPTGICYYKRQLWTPQTLNLKAAVLLRNFFFGFHQSRESVCIVRTFFGHQMPQITLISRPCQSEAPPGDIDVKLVARICII